MSFVFRSGAQLTVKSTCTEGHEYVWKSCANVRDEGKGPARVNVDICSSILLSGLTFTAAEVCFFVK